MIFASVHLCVLIAAIQMVRYFLSLYVSKLKLPPIFSSGVVKKMTGGFFKIVHERHRAKNADEQIEMQIMQMQEITKLYPDLKPVLQKSTVSLIVECC